LTENSTVSNCFKKIFQKEKQRSNFYQIANSTEGYSLEYHYKPQAENEKKGKKT
jgi:hypothetical protein